MDSIDQPPDWTVHQAAGMVSVQLSIPVAAAAQRLGEYAELHDEPLHDVAVRVVARELHFA